MKENELRKLTKREIEVLNSYLRDVREAEARLVAFQTGLIAQYDGAGSISITPDGRLVRAEPET